MADSSDNTLEILINLRTQGEAGVKAAKELLAETAGAATAGGDATKDLGKKTEEATESFRLFNTQNREFKLLLGEANQIAPGLGVALRGLFNPEVLGIGLAILAVKTFVDWLKEGKKSADEMADAISKIDASVWQAQIQGIIDTKEQHRQLKEALAKGLEDPGAMDARYTHEKKLMEEKLAQQKKLLEFMEAIQLADAHGDKGAEDAIKDRFKGIFQGLDNQGGQAEVDRLNRKGQDEYNAMLESKRKAEAAQAELDKGNPGAATATRAKTEQLLHADDIATAAKLAREAHDMESGNSNIWGNFSTWLWGSKHAKAFADQSDAGLAGAVSSEKNRKSVIQADDDWQEAHKKAVRENTEAYQRHSAALSTASVALLDASEKLQAQKIEQTLESAYKAFNFVNNLMSKVDRIGY